MLLQDADFAVGQRIRISLIAWRPAAVIRPDASQDIGVPRIKGFTLHKFLKAAENDFAIVRFLIIHEEFAGGGKEGSRQMLLNNLIVDDLIRDVAQGGNWFAEDSQHSERAGQGIVPDSLMHQAAGFGPDVPGVQQLDDSRSEPFAKMSPEIIR